MGNLFPIGYENEVIAEADLVGSKTVGYRNGVSFDEQAGDFRRDGKNRMLDSTGIESWESWCINCLSTERYSCLAYSTDFGIETALVFGADSREEAESILTRQITEALLADPYKRTAYIENIEFDWTTPDAVGITLTIHGIENVSIDVVAYLTREK